MLYLGRKRIASGGGTTTVTAHQFTNDISDIKPDGASASLGVLDTIVRADHVHPITIATLSSLGVVKPNKALGTSIDANGNLSVEVANSSEIASRTSQTKVIYTGNLNNSVKAALTDTNHLTMTTAEQATARSIIGVDTVERLATIYDKDSTDATINQGLTSGVDFPNDDTANYVGNCTRSKYKGLYLLFSSYNDPGASLFVRVYVPNVASVSRFGLVTPYQGSNSMLYWGHGMWNYDRLDLLHLRECNETTTTVSNSTRFKLVKVEGVLL